MAFTLYEFRSIEIRFAGFYCWYIMSLLLYFRLEIRKKKSFLLCIKALETAKHTMKSMIKIFFIKPLSYNIKIFQNVTFSSQYMYVKLIFGKSNKIRKIQMKLYFFNLKIFANKCGHAVYEVYQSKSCKMFLVASLTTCSYKQSIKSAACVIHKQYFSFQGALKNTIL